MSKSKAKEKTARLVLIHDARAVPPDHPGIAALVPHPTLSEEDCTRPFREDGWVFVTTRSAPERSYPVVREKGGQVKIVAPSLNVKFRSKASEQDVESILGAENLHVRRRMGFSENAVLVTGNDILEKVRRLNGNNAVEWASPTLIEPLGGRR